MIRKLLMTVYIAFLLSLIIHWLLPSKGLGQDDYYDSKIDPFPGKANVIVHNDTNIPVVAVAIVSYRNRTTVAYSRINSNSKRDFGLYPIGKYGLIIIFPDESKIIRWFTIYESCAGCLSTNTGYPDYETKWEYIIFLNDILK